MNIKIPCIKLFIFLIGLVLLFIFYMNFFVGLINGYILVDEVSEDNYIKKNGKIVVQNTVVDYQVIHEYLIGLRMPSDFLECENGKLLLIRVRNEQEFFIIDTNNNKVLILNEKEKFLEALKPLGIYNDVRLNYSKFQEKYKKYSRYNKDIDFSKCKNINAEMNSRVHYY
jgi:hypothetical protein